MKTFDFIQVTISHNVKDPHSKALEPDCLSPLLAVTTQSQREEGGGEGVDGDQRCIKFRGRQSYVCDTRGRW
jgi:hypothetical protein